jgi:anti-sigma B factor antagonist
MQLNITVTEKQGVAVLDLSGRVVAGDECDALRSKIRDLLASDKKKILLSLGGVTRIDSTGIGMLVESVIYTTKQGGELKLVNLPRLIGNILATHRLLQAFDIYAHEEEAIGSFKKQAKEPVA